MNKVAKNAVIVKLEEKFNAYNNIYVTDTESLSVAQFNDLRRQCFERNVEMYMAKNTLIHKALKKLESDKYSQVTKNLKGVSVLWFSENPKEPAVIINEFRLSSKGEKPLLKVAIIGDDVYVGDDQLATLKSIKSKQEFLGEVLTLLQSPIQGVASGLSNTALRLAGSLKALSKKISA